MSDLTAERDALVARARDVILGKIVWTGHKSAEINADLDALLLAYRSALAGETDDKVLWRAIEATYTDANCERIEKELDKQGAGPATVENHVEAAIRAAAPILRAPLLVQLQDKDERIKAYETLERWLEDEDTYMSFCGEDVRQHGPLACLNRWRQKFPKEAS